MIRTAPGSSVVEVFSQWRRRRASRRIEPGDGHPLEPFRWWQMFSRALLHLRLDRDGATQTWSVDVRLWGDDDGVVHARLYRDGRHEATSKVPAHFPLPDGTVEVGASEFGLKRCHLVRPDGSERQLTPDPASAEGHRLRLDRRHPAASRAIGLSSWAMLAVALVLGVPQLVETLTQIPPVADSLDTFTSPLSLPASANVALVVGSLLASTERALRLRNHWLLDGGLLDDEV